MLSAIPSETRPLPMERAQRAAGAKRDQEQGCRRPIVMVSSWWPTVVQPLANPFVVDHARALQECDGDLQCCVVAPGWRGARSGVVRPDKVGAVVSREPRIPALVASTNAGSRLLGMSVAAFERGRRQRPRAVVLQSFSYAGPYAIALARSAGCPLIYVEHWSAVGLRELPRRQLAGLRRVLSASDRVLAVSRYLGATLEDIGGLPSRSVGVVENVVDVSLFRPAGKPAHSGTVIAQIADFRPIKDHGLLVAALSKMGSAELDHLDLHFVLIGDGPLRDSVRRGLQTNPAIARRVRFTGSLPRHEVAREIAAADWTMLTSRVETSSCVARESLVVGRPVIAPRVGALPELVTHEDGLLYERNVAGLITAIRTATTQNDQRAWQRISTSASERFAPERLAASYGRVLSDVGA